MRSSSQAFVLIFGILLSTATARAGVCPGDCNADGALTASDFGRMQSLLFRCGLCNGKAGAVVTGCGGSNGCPTADLNDDGCFTAAEFSFFLRRGAGFTDPVEPGRCRIDKGSFPGNRPNLACDCNGDGVVTASDLGRLISLTTGCSTCNDGSAGAPADGCPARPIGCRAADPDGDGCIRATDVTQLCAGFQF